MINKDKNDEIKKSIKFYSLTNITGSNLLKVNTKLQTETGINKSMSVLLYTRLGITCKVKTPNNFEVDYGCYVNF